MKTEQITINKIIADEKMILTDGNTYGRIIFLGQDKNASDFYEITEEEYNKIIESGEVI